MRKSVISFDEKMSWWKGDFFDDDFLRNGKGVFDKYSFSYIYYFAYKGEQIITTAQEYKRAWRGYWLDIDDGMHSWDAIWNMRITYGGVARKQPIPDVNVLYDGQIEEIVDLAVNHIWKEVEQKI